MKPAPTGSAHRDFGIFQKSWMCLVSFFFEGLDRIDDREAGKKNILENKEALDLVRCYYAIPENQRKRLFDLARVLGDAA
jgi:hypothetical protein